jgi:hypothetical protein
VSKPVAEIIDPTASQFPPGDLLRIYALGRPGAPSAKWSTSPVVIGPYGGRHLVTQGAGRVVELARERL